MKFDVSRIAISQPSPSAYGSFRALQFRINGMDILNEYVQNQLSGARRCLSVGNPAAAKRHLERAHVIGQAITREHTRVHWQMLKLGWQMRDVREIFGQLLRIVGAATKTPFGIYPKGNTGGADVWFFKPMPVPADLQEILDKAKMN